MGSSPHRAGRWVRGTAVKGTVGAVAIVGVIAAPLALLFANADEQDMPELVSAGLDAKAIPAEYRTWVEKAGKVCKGVSSPLIAAQIDAESRWNPKAISPVGAKGLSQFMPSTWRAEGVDVASRNGDEKPDGIADPFTPGDAIMSQAKYDCGLMKGVDERLKAGTIKGDRVSLTLAAYNAGMTAVESAGGVPRFAETQTYVKKIFGLMSEYTASSGGSGFGGRVVKEALKWKGERYSWGGGTIEGPSAGFGKGTGVIGFDCSSLVQYAVYHASNGKILLPRVSQEQVKKGKHVSSLKQAKPGDVIGFALNGPGNYDHIGVYMGGGKMVHAPKPGDRVKVSSVTDANYTSKPMNIRRFG